MTTRQQKVVRIGAFVLCLGSVFLLGWTCGKAAEKATASARHAADIVQILWNIDPVESHTVYLQLDMRLDGAVVDAAEFKPFLLMPGDRRDFDAALSQVAQYRREHPRWRPTPGEVAKAQDERHGKKSDLYVDATPKTQMGGELEAFEKKLAGDADAVLAQYPAPPK